MPINDKDTVNIGDTVEVELTVSSDESYEYIALEDPKPAGFEPVQLQSGYAWGDGLCSNVELRDEQVIFFAGRLPSGKHVLSYNLRAEVPGSYLTRPTKAFDMYNPQIHAQSAGGRIHVRD